MKGPLRQTYDWKNRVRKQRDVGRVYEMKYSVKDHKDRNGHKNRTNTIKRSGQDINHDIPTT